MVLPLFITYYESAVPSFMTLHIPYGLTIGSIQCEFLAGEGRAQNHVTLSWLLVNIARCLRSGKPRV